MDFFPIVVGILAALLTLLVLSRLASSRRRPPVLPGASQVFPLDDVTQLHEEARDLLKHQLTLGEAVKVVIRGPWDQAIIATERRLFIFKRGWMGGAFLGRKMTSWDYRTITGISMETTALGGIVAVEIPGGSAGADRGYFSGSNPSNTLPITRESYDTAAKGVAEIRRLISEHQSGGRAIQGSLAQEMERLARLHERGQLTDDEFATMKRRLMSF